MDTKIIANGPKLPTFKSLPVGTMFTDSVQNFLAVKIKPIDNSDSREKHNAVIISNCPDGVPAEETSWWPDNTLVKPVKTLTAEV